MKSLVDLSLLFIGENAVRYEAELFYGKLSNIVYNGSPIGRDLQGLLLPTAQD